MKIRIAENIKNLRKAHFLRTIFTLIGQKEYFGGLVMTKIPHALCGESNAFLEERMEKAVLPTVLQIQEYVTGIDGQAPLSARLERDFE